MLEYITCTKCKKQQKRENFKYHSEMHKVCKYCNGKTNVIPGDYNVTTEEVLNLLSKVVFTNEDTFSLSIQMELQPVFTFLKRQVDKEKELEESK